MKNMLTYYAQRGHTVAKKELLERSQGIIKGISFQYYKKYNFIFNIEELLVFAQYIFYDCLKYYSFFKKANYFTFLKKIFRL